MKLACRRCRCRADSRRHELAEGSGHLEGLADENVVRPADLNHVYRVRTVAQFQYAIDAAAGVLDEGGGLRFIGCVSHDDRSCSRTPVLRNLTFDSLVRPRLRHLLRADHARQGAKADDHERSDRDRERRCPGRDGSDELSKKSYEHS